MARAQATAAARVRAAMADRAAVANKPPERRERAARKVRDRTATVRRLVTPSRAVMRVDSHPASQPTRVRHEALQQVSLTPCAPVSI